MNQIQGNHFCFELSKAYANRVFEKSEFHLILRSLHAACFYFLADSEVEITKA